MRFDERITEIQEFLTFAIVGWPELRDKVADQISHRCVRCILSEKCVSLVDGICEFCRAAEQPGIDDLRQRHGTAQLERNLSEVLHGYSNTPGRTYDALVLFSGGKDSAYLLHRLHSEFPALRLLALTVDNGFFSQVAMANCRRILERIHGVDHMVFQPEAELYRKTFRHAFTHLNEGGCYTTVDRMDGDLTFDIGRNLAASLGIPLLIAGLSPEQVERILGLTTFETRTEDERYARTESAGFRLADIYDANELRKYWWNGTIWPDDRIPRVVYPYYAWSYDEDVIRKTVVELELIDAGQDNPLITNNDTIPLMLAVDLNKLGYSGFEPEFAELIRTGKTERAPWLAVFEAAEYLCRQGRLLPRSIADTLQRLGLTPSDLAIPLATTQPPNETRTA